MVQNKKRLYILLLLLFSALVTMIACEPDRGEDVTKQELDDGEMPEKPEELIVWINDDDSGQGDALEIMKPYFDNYTEKTGIDIVLEIVPMPDQVQKLALAGPGGDGPDLFFQPQDRLGDVVAQGLAQPMTFTDEELGGYSEAAIDAFTYEGEVYGAPIAIETYFTYYNKSIVEEVPTTIEDIYKMSLEFTNSDNDEYGFLISPEFYYLYSFMNSHGGYIFGEEDGIYNVDDIGLNNDGSIKGLEEYLQFVNAGILPRTVTVDVLDGLFTEGKVGMVISGPWNISSYREALGDDLGTAPLPKIGEQIAPSFVGVKSWLVSSYSKNAEWAVDLAKFLTNDESAELYHDITGELPPRPVILEAVTDPIYTGHTQQIDHGISMPNIPEMSAIWDMDDAIQLIINGEDIEDVLTETVQNIKDKIDLY
ncbi:extracellular solute-binding protein [Amphibacillus sp. MSJ-3]|uniref:sugar ABC transporter substrate-binding protein n=1 Tax=Amphibacillus sp. MSJ-3 TaxID=2841505 RepID=UPI001C0F2D49|nr:extracellular solute-binding protein [Amphibacillus sp. MSJ-3]MBU5594083.1 extracellular solute-binding protein [Amphibacillus sp. MSJ-3]